jgi:two-component system, response regulator PdtaR
MSAATVLTVDDDPIVRADLRLVLEDAGYTVCEDARNGIEAVELARTQRPDLILLDLAMPLLDGVEATRRIMEERPVPIVVLTGHAGVEGGIADRALEAGAVSVVRKPFSENAVVGAVRDALGTPALPDVAAERAASRAAIAEIVGSMGYPSSWADELEARAFRSGNVWRRV